MIELLTNKTQEEKADIKSVELAKLNHTGIFTRGEFEMEIISLTKIEGGVEVLARAWKNGEQLGFGDGTVEIERFKIYNPPVLVGDPVGIIVRTWYNDIDQKTEEQRFREDPKEAIRRVLVHNVSLVGKGGSNIKIGKVGNTVSTFYPNAHTETTSVDGYVVRTGGTWTNVRDTADGTASSDSATGEWIMSDNDSPGSYTCTRHFYLFDTSAIGSDTVDSATFSAYQSNNGEGDRNVGLIQTSPASNTALVVGDFDAMTINSPAEGTDARVLCNGTGVYRDFVMNATGLGWIVTGGITKLGLRMAFDIDNTAPTARNYSRFDFADQTGTTQDPKLVVTHSASAGAVFPHPTLLTLGLG